MPADLVGKQLALWTLNPAIALQIRARPLPARSSRHRCMHLAARGKLQGDGPKTRDIRSATFAFMLRWGVWVTRL